MCDVLLIFPLSGDYLCPKISPVKKILLILLLLLAGVAVWYFAFNKKKDDPQGPKQQPIVSKYSHEFNQSVQKMMNAYFSMNEGFVNWDTLTINRQSAELKSALDSIRMDEVKKDSSIYETAFPFWDNLKVELAGLISDSTLAEKRGSLNIFSENLYNFLRTVRYDQGKVYWQDCPMAFGEDTHGFWLSNTIDIRNPYLGLHHPKYGKSMLICGETRDTLNFMPTDSTIK
jgi:hypothetical protein